MPVADVGTSVSDQANNSPGSNTYAQPRQEKHDVTPRKNTDATGDVFYAAKNKDGR